MIGESVKGALRWMMLAKGLSQVISWLVTLIVIRILTPADYGLFAMASMLVVLAEMLKEMGLGSALVQAKELGDRSIRQIFTLVLLSNMVLFAIIVLTAPLMARVFAEDALEILIPVLALQFPILALETVPEAMLSRRMDFRSKALIAAAGAFANSITMLSCALLGMGVWALIFGNLASALAMIVLYAARTPIAYRPTLDFSGVGRFISFGGFVTLSRFLNVMLVQSSFFVIGRVLGKEALGVFSVAHQLATLPMQKVSGILNEVGFAAFSRIQDDRLQVADHYVKAMGILAFVSFPTFWGLASVADSLTVVVLGNKWLDIVLPLQLIAFVTPFRMIFNTTTPALLGIGRADTFFTNLVIVNIAMPIAVFIGTEWGVNGASLAWLIAYPPLFVLVQNRSLRRLNVSAGQLAAACSKAAGISAVMMLAVLATYTWLLDGRVPELVTLGLLVILGAATYVLASLALNRGQIMETKAVIYR